MAKRKRLTPAQPGYLEGGTALRAPEVKSMPGPLSGAAPIAQVAGEAATRAALQELSSALESARAEGRLIEEIALDDIRDHHLSRDRIARDDEDMTALIESLRARGQQTAIEVTRLQTPAKGGAGFGLISGWRRLSALRRLHDETGEARFARVRAVITAPGSAQAAYVAMVEENEIRSDLSFFERARIVRHACNSGVYLTQTEALKGLFGSVSRSKRSKIGSFIPVVRALEDVLNHPTAISEKLGLALSKEIATDENFVSDLRDRLLSAPRESAAEEIQILSGALAAKAARLARGAGARPDRPAPVPAAEPVADGIALRFDPARGQITLSGDRVDGDLCGALSDWLAAR